MRQLERALRAFAPVVATIGLVAHASPALSDSHGAQAHRGHSGHADGAGAGVDPAPVSSHSLFHLGSVWTDSKGGNFPLSRLGGRVQVVAMVYTHCEHACPRIIADMRRLREALGDTGGRVGFNLVSLDPDRDDVARLAEFAEARGLGDEWTLLRGDPRAVRELAAALGIRYRRVSDTDFVHSNLISILDPTGVVVHRQIGLGVDPDEAAAVVRGLLEKEE